MLDINKPVQTRDGRPVTILTTAATPALVEALGSAANLVHKDDVIIAQLKDEDGVVGLYGYSAEGRFLKTLAGPADLVNVPEETVEWRVIYLNRLDPEDTWVGSNRRAFQDAMRAMRSAGNGVCVVKLTLAGGEIIEQQVYHK